MRPAFLLGIFIFAYSTFAQADFDVCSSYVEKNPQMAKAVEFLRSVEGFYWVGDCSIEIHACDSFANDDSRGGIVGDILIQNSKGEERYIQFEFPKEKSPGLKVQIQNGKFMLHYEFDDRNGSKKMGHLESARIEFLKSADRTKFKSVEEGWYSTADWAVRKKNGSVYRWIQCHGDVPVDFINEPKSEAKFGDLK